MNFSIIIPVFNIEKYLSFCIDSVLKQTYQKFEVILVDDGSIDASPDICNLYGRRDPRVKVIHKNNGGLSDARNVGVREASGDYLIFLDGDDFWRNNNGLELLVEEITKCPECDFIGFNCSYYYPSSKKFADWVQYETDLSQVSKSTDCIIKLVKSGTFPMSACLKVIKRSFFINNNLFFLKGKYCEDIPWFIDLLSKADKCKFVNLYLYSYRKEVEGSISSSFGIKKWEDLFAHLKNGVKYLQTESLMDEQTKNALFSFWAYEYYILLGMLYFMSREERSHRRLHLLKYDWLVKYSLNPKVFKVNFLRKFVGLKITNLLLYLYLTRSIKK